MRRHPLAAFFTLAYLGSWLLWSPRWRSRSGTVQEEPGWRGFALPRMQRPMHPVSATVGLVVVHTFWHAPPFLTREWDTAR